MIRKACPMHHTQNSILWVKGCGTPPLSLKLQHPCIPNIISREFQCLTKIAPHWFSAHLSATLQTISKRTERSELNPGPRNYNLLNERNRRICVPRKRRLLSSLLHSSIPQSTEPQAASSNTSRDLIAPPSASLQGGGKKYIRTHLALAITLTQTPSSSPSPKTKTPTRNSEKKIKKEVKEMKKIIIKRRPSLNNSTREFPLILSRPHGSTA